MELVLDLPEEDRRLLAERAAAEGRPVEEIAAQAVHDHLARAAAHRDLVRTTAEAQGAKWRPLLDRLK